MLGHKHIVPQLMLVAILLQEMRVMQVMMHGFFSGIPPMKEFNKY